MKKKNKKFRRFCFYTFNVLMGLVFGISVSCLDSGMWQWYVLALVSILYLRLAHYLCEHAKELKGAK